MNTMVTTISGQRSHMGNTPAHVIKVGGENASDPRTAQWLAQFRNDGNQVAVAISALRTKPLNTTTELIGAMNLYRGGCTGDAYMKLRNLKKVHLTTLDEAGMLDEALRETLESLYREYFMCKISLPSDLVKGDEKVLWEQRFIGYGEVMSAHVLSYILTTRYGIMNTFVVDVFDPSGRNLNTTLRDELGKRVGDILANGGIAIVPGYQSVKDQKILPVHGRGYTDKTAERLAVGLSDQGYAPILHIQKQVPLLSSNPNTTPTARAIEHLSYHSAAEITGARGANAQVLNEHTISHDLAERGIPVLVYNPFEKYAPKSTISHDGNQDNKILFVDGRDHVSTVTISGFAMSGPGLLARLTDVFQKQKISIDSISSSETEVTFTAYGEMPEDKKNTLYNALSGDLGDEYKVEIKNNLGLIYCIGDNLAGHPGILEKITGTLAREGIDIECISQSRGQRAVTIGVNSKNLRKGIESLHTGLIEK